MNYVDNLIEGPEQRRDVVLVVILWTIVGLAIAAVVLAANRRAIPAPIDLEATTAITTGRAALRTRVPVPNGDCSVMLPGQSSILSDTATNVVAARLPGDGPGLIAVGVITAGRSYMTVSPGFTESRRVAFLRNWTSSIEMCRGPFHAEDILWYRPVTARGLRGFEASFVTGSVSKRQVELFNGPRCFKFEIVRSEGPLGDDDIGLFHAVVASLEDVADLKKDLTP